MDNNKDQNFEMVTQQPQDTQELVAVEVEKDTRVELTPKQVVEELDKYIIGQASAKRAVAIALRNRYRRSMLDEKMAEEIIPKNILMIGPTGVGKTEIARRLARLVNAPFIKVEATKFTEVGYVGRDVESIIRDLMEAAVRIIKEEKNKEVEAMAREAANDELAKLLMPKDARDTPPSQGVPLANIFGGPVHQDPEMKLSPEERERRASIRASIRQQLDYGLLEEQMIEIEVEDTGTPMDLSSMGISIDINEMMGGMMPKKMKIRKLTVAEARKIIQEQEADKLIDMDDVIREALLLCENHGIVFLDEIDKIAGRQGGGGGPDVSREGVQRDILPIVEGSTVSTKYGPVKTDHILFIAAGAFHVAKVEDLIPELQGRFPITVTLDSLTAEDFGRILVEPENALTKQYEALLGTEGVKLEFTKEGIQSIAEYAFESNESSENLGARRLHTIMESLLEEESFMADTITEPVVVDARFVDSRLENDHSSEALRKFIL